MHPSRMMKLIVALATLASLCLISNQAQAQDQTLDDLEAEFLGQDLPDSEDRQPAAESEPTQQNRPSAEELEDIPEASQRKPGQPYKIKHPNAKKGLIRITKDKTYIYAVPSTPQKHAASLRFGLFNPVNVENPQNGALFGDLYEDTKAPIVMFDYEWQLWRGALGKFGLKAGTGIYAANGNGRFVSDSNAGLTPKETFTFIVLPNTVSAVWRLQFTDNQILVPYAEGGLGYYTFSEIRDDYQGPKFGGALTAHGAGGVAINLGFINSESMLTLDREHGINNVFLTAEVRIVQGLHTDFDFSSTVYNGGILVEF